MIELQGKRIKLRQWQFTDEGYLVKYANNPNVSAYLGDRFPSPYTLNEAKNWLLITQPQQPPINMAIIHSNEVIGGIGLEIRQDIYRKTALIGYWLAEPFWGMGLMTRP